MRCCTPSDTQADYNESIGMFKHSGRKKSIGGCFWLCAALCVILMLSPLTGGAWAAGCAPVQIRNPEGNYIMPGVWGDIVYRRIDGTELSLDAYVQKLVQKHRERVGVPMAG